MPERGRRTSRYGTDVHGAAGRARSTTTSAPGSAASEEGGTSSLRSREPPPTITWSTRHDGAVDPDRECVGQAVRGDAADLHSGDVDRLVAIGEGCLPHAEPPPHHAVHVEPGRREDEARGVHPRLRLADNDDRVRRLVEGVAVRLTERGGVGEVGIAGDDLVRRTRRLGGREDRIVSCGSVSRRLVHQRSVPGRLAPTLARWLHRPAG